MKFSNSLKLTLMASIAFTSFGCSATGDQAKPAKTTGSDLPVIKVEKKYNQVLVKDRNSKPPIYELNGPVKGFILDTSEFNFDDYKVPKTNDSAKKTIQIVHTQTNAEKDSAAGGMKYFAMPFDQSQKVHKIELLKPVDSNNTIIVGIGWEAKVKEKIDLRPVWAGSIKVK